MKIGFDNELYMQKQREQINDRISRFSGKLYLEFGGKLFDDYHAARVLPGFQPDAKIRLLRSMADQICQSALMPRGRDMSLKNTFSCLPLSSVGAVSLR